MRTDGDAPVAGGPPPLFAQSRVPRLGDPVVLLREKFHIDLPAWMLQPFGKSGQYRFLSKDIYPWRPVWPSEGDCAFSLYFELANRICFLEHLSVLHPHARLVIYRCLDSLIPLAIYMTMSGRYAGLSREELYPVWPRFSAVSSEDSLPDIAMHIFYSSHYNDSGIPFTHPADMQMVEILRKAEPSACRFRGYDSIILKMFSKPESQYLRDALFRLVLASLLGTYASSGMQTCFMIRYRLYCWYCFESENTQSFISWLKRSATLMTYCLRELIFEAAERVPTFRDHMMMRRRWCAIRRNTFECMDAWRAAMNRAAGHSIGGSMRLSSSNRKLVLVKEFEPVDVLILIDHFNDHNLRISPRPMAEHWRDKMRNVFLKIRENVPLPTISPEESSAVFAMTTVLRAYEPHQRFPYEMLHRWFGVSLESVLELMRAEDLYRREVKRTQIDKAIVAIRARSAYDFRLLCAYFECLYTIYGLLFYDLPYDISERQIRALRIRYGLSPGEPMHPDAGTFLVCPNCTFFKSFVSHDASRRGQEVRIPVLEGLTLKIYCRRKVPRMHMMTTKKTKAKASKRDGRRLHEEFCRDTEVIPVNMIGRIAWSREQKACVFMCPDCANLTTYGIHSFTHGLLSCGCRDWAQYSSPPRCVLCNKTEKKINWAIVADDRQKIEIKVLPFCSKHKPRWKELEEIETLSDIKEKLDRHAFTISLRNDDGQICDRISVISQSQFVTSV